MGSSGHAFIAHTKALSPRAQPKDGGYGAPPHPLAVRAGQLYWPRAAGKRRVLVVTRVQRQRVTMAALERRDALVHVTLSRVLALRADDQGRHYQFQGFLPRRYQTLAYVWSTDDREAVLCVPEWHPRRAARLAVRLLPENARRSGTWVRVRCDLSASSAARLQLADLVATPEPDRQSTHPPALTDPADLRLASLERPSSPMTDADP
jgi:hypothetical protein